MASHTTQKDIAQRLNLSQSLVARVLNNRPNLWVSEQKRQLILQTAREMNYRPHRAAHALRAGKTQIVACIFLESAGHHAIVETLADCMAARGYSLLVHVVLTPAQPEQDAARWLSTGLFDAVIVWGLEEHVEPIAMLLERDRFPFVVKGRFEQAHPDWFQVDFDHEGMIRDAVSHLCAHGHRNIAYIGYDIPQIYAHRLVDGYRQGMEALLGMPIRQDYIARIGSRGGEATVLLRRWLELPPVDRPTAIIMGVGEAAWQEIEIELARRGQRVGEQAGEFSLCGLGGSSMQMLFGEASHYSEAELATLARAMAEQLVLPMLHEKPPEATVIRVRPSLHRVPSLKLPLPG